MFDILVGMGILLTVTVLSYVVGYVVIRFRTVNMSLYNHSDRMLLGFSVVLGVAVFILFSWAIGSMVNDSA